MKNQTNDQNLPQITPTLPRPPPPQKQKKDKTYTYTHQPDYYNYFFYITVQNSGKSGRARRDGIECVFRDTQNGGSKGHRIQK